MNLSKNCSERKWLKMSIFTYDSLVKGEQMIHSLKLYGDYVGAALRIVVGYTYALHGAQKLFGMFGAEQSVEIVSLIGLAGFIELVGGTMISVGFLTRPVALIASGEMAFAYFIGHVARNGAFFFPLANQGEPAVLYCFIFLYLSAHDTGRYGIDGLLSRR